MSEVKHSLEELVVCALPEAEQCLGAIALGQRELVAYPCDLGCHGWHSGQEELGQLGKTPHELP